MEPTFHDKEYLLTDKISYKRRQPLRGEVVVFHAPPQAGCPKGTGCDFIKRVIGLPGDRVEVRDNGLFVNGQKLKEDYLPANIITDAGVYSRNKLVSLGQDEYFVVGDNRPHSSDSRMWGPIKYDEIVGRVFFRYWPPDRLGAIHDPLYAFK
jgi:signal peptidase I